MIDKAGDIGMTLKLHALLLTLILTPALAMAAGDPVKGKQKAEACAACHQLNGISETPNIPNLAGQSARYIADQWALYAAGKRKDELMASVVTMINDMNDIKDIAAYYESLPRRKTGATTSAAALKLANATYNGISNCYLCHGEKGEGMNHRRFFAPVLAGQHKEYTIKTLKEFASRQRTSSEYTMMNDVMGRITEQDIEAIAEYLSNL